MPKAKPVRSSDNTRKMRPALSPEARENQMISLATDLVEQRLRDGTATSQETTHFLKLATYKTRLENEILESQKMLIEAKTKSLESSQHMEELCANVMEAIKRYSGQEETDPYE